MWFLLVALALFVVVSLLLVYLKTPKVSGSISEQLLAARLEIHTLFKRQGKILTNVYLPKEDGSTSEIDVLYITKKGLLVFENKNYAGYIFGSEEDLNWTVTLRAGKKVEKFKFYNPIRQNKNHMKNLGLFLGKEIQMFSLVTFSNRSSFKNVSYYESTELFVIHHSRVFWTLWKIWKNNPDVLSEEEISELYLRLVPLAYADQTAKEKHVSDIHEKFNNTEKCPLCGGELVVRKVRKGPNYGKEFLGCSNYPKCHYTKDF